MDCFWNETSQVMASYQIYSYYQRFRSPHQINLKIEETKIQFKIYSILYYNTARFDGAIATGSVLYMLYCFVVFCCFIWLLNVVFTDLYISTYVVMLAIHCIVDLGISHAYVSIFI